MMDQSVNSKTPKFSSLPDWEIAPRKFFEGQEGYVFFLLHERRMTGKPPLALAKFIAEYSAGLDENLPPKIIKKLIAQAIDVFEKSTAAAVETAG